MRPGEAGRGLRNRLPERDWRVLDKVIAIGWFIAVEAELALKPALEGPRGINMAVYGAAALTLLVRRDRPLVTVVAVGAAGLAGAAWLTGPPDVTSSVLLIMASGYAVGVHGKGREPYIGLAIVVLVIGGVSFLENDADVAFPVVFFGFVPWLVGRTLRHQQALSQELAEKADRAEHEREDAERRAIEAERARIARELHDVLAHNLSVMVVQASAAQRVVDRDPDTASDAAHLIRATGREALAELRHLFGTVRRGEGEPLAGPPGISQIEHLASRAREAGLSVKVSVEGTPVPLPAGVDVTAYRLVQEALTNTLKHAGSANATVSVRYEPWEVIVEVEDDGKGTDGNGDLSATGGGHGLVGMRERVQVYGGKMQAGRRRGGGFAVRARLPTLSTHKTEVVS